MLQTLPKHFLDILHRTSGKMLNMLEKQTKPKYSDYLLIFIPKGQAFIKIFKLFFFLILDTSNNFDWSNEISVIPFQENCSKQR